MSDITYTARQDSPESIQGFEQYQSTDTNIINSYQVNNLFDTTKHIAQLHILDVADTLLESRYNYTRYTLSANAQSAGRTGASILTISPIDDALAYGYSYGGIKLLYHFLSDLYTQDNTTLEFYVDGISEDRKELSLLTLNLTADEVTTYTQQIRARLADQSDFSEFRLDFKDNNLFIGINIDTLDTPNGKSVVVKLYEPLPTNYSVRSTLNILETISDSIAYEIDYEVEQIQEAPPNLRPANFSIDIAEQSIVPTQYLGYDELLSYSVDNTNSEIYSMLNEKGIDISLDYTDYSTFIHFSSAQERLLNFKYKVDLLTEYSQKLDLASTLTSGALGTSGSVSYYENLYQGIINNFDHYERFLYYESGSSCWPKSNTTKPYINIPSKDPITNIPNAIVTSWYSGALTNSIAYDRTNYSILSEAIPTYLKDDDSNEKYLTFVYMIGQHFDNLWVYGKAVTDKYDADNRLDFGISKDLVGEALKNFGVKLYTSNKSTEDLFATFIGQAYQSGSEKINYYITGSLTGSNAPIQPSSFDDYQKDIQKRIYHNLPLLLKSKGTERGLRALINCFGIPSNILQIKLYGGRNINERPFFGDYQHYTSSLSKIRLDHTGSLVSGSTLSAYTSIVKRDPKYTDDLHVIEVGFSPTDNVDAYIISHSAASFNIDNYIGDPGNLTSDLYQGLNAVAEGILENLNQYNLQDYVRLIKFFDNVIFKMVKDFIPARALADTGIIVKPNLLNRSKAKSVAVEVEVVELNISASIDTAFITGSNARAFGANDDYITGYTTRVQTPWGIGGVTNNQQEQPKYNGELLNSGITVSNGELNQANPYKYPSAENFVYNIQLWDIASACIFDPAIGTAYVTSSTALYNANHFFPVGTLLTTVYTSSNPAGGVIYPTMPVSFSGYAQYDEFYMTASNGIVNNSECVDIVNVVYGTCSLSLTPAGYATQSVAPNQTVNISNWFNIHPDQAVDCTVESPPGIITPVNGGPFTSESIFQHTFPNAVTTANITISDPKLGGYCSLTKTLDVNSCNLRGYKAKLTYNTSIVQQQLPKTDIQIGPNPPFNWPANDQAGLNRYFIGAVPGLTRFVITLNAFDAESEQISLYTDNPGGDYWNYFLPANFNYNWIRIQAFNSPACTAVVNVYNRTYFISQEDQDANNANTTGPNSHGAFLCVDNNGDPVSCDASNATFPPNP